VHSIRIGVRSQKVDWAELTLPFFHFSGQQQTASSLTSHRVQTT